MKRTLSLVLALVMVLGTFSTVFAAVEDDAADVLEQIGVLLGDDDGNLMLDKNLERRDSVVLLTRLLGVEDEASEFLYTEELPSWADVDSDPYYLGYLAWAESNEYYQGDDEGNFNPRNPITAQEFLLVLFRALGYEDPVWGEEFELAEELGLLEGTDLEEKDELLRGAMSVLILNALNTKVNGEDVTLAEKLEIEMPTPAALEVAAVVADNLKEVEVVFNQEVEKETVVNANVQVKDEKGSVALKDDGVTAVITVDENLKNQTEYTLVVEGVKSVKGVVIEKAEIKFRAFDAELPEVLGLEVTGPRQFAITFSEPINGDAAEKGTVTVKQGNSTLGNTYEVSGNKANVTVYTNFVEGREYEVRVEGFKDYAGYNNIVELLTFTYEKDSTPPVATVEKAEQEYIIVSFNKPVKGLDKDDFYHTFSAWTAKELKDMDDKTVESSKSYDKVKVVFYDASIVGEDKGKAIPAGSTVFGINGKDIKDNWGNALGNVEFTISTSADRVAPEVKEINVVDEDEIEVVFTKNVKALTRDNVEILDAEGKKISGLYWYTPVVGDDASEYTIRFNQNLAGKTITVSIKNVKDTTLYENVLTIYTEVIEITDKSKPVVKNVYYELLGKDGDAGKYTKKDLFVVFDESVDPDTALKASNYALVYPAVEASGDTPAKKAEVVILTQAPSFDNFDSRVKLPLTDTQADKLYNVVATSGHGVTLQVINVEDLAGNAILPVLNALDGIVSGVIAAPTAKLLDKNTIELKFAELLSGITQAKVAVTIKTGEDTTKVLTANEYGINVVNNTVTALEINVDKLFGTDTSIIKDITIDLDGVKNSFNVPAKFGEGTTLKVESFTDAAKPEVKEVRVIAGSKVVEIEFSEDMNQALFTTLSFEVENRELAAVDTIVKTDRVLKLTVDESFAANEALTVIYRNQVADAEGNLLDQEIGDVIEGKVLSE